MGIDLSLEALSFSCCSPVLVSSNEVRSVSKIFKADTFHSTAAGAAPGLGAVQSDEAWGNRLRLAYTHRNINTKAMYIHNALPRTPSHAQLFTPAPHPSSSIPPLLYSPFSLSCLTLHAISKKSCSSFR